MTADVNINSAIQGALDTAKSQATIGQDIDDFLFLLTQQLQNQDPLDPLDTNQFTQQLVQFSQVEQSIRTNDKLDSLVQLELSSITNLALGYVGLNASYLSSELNYDGSTPVNVDYVLSGPASQGSINITDEEGNLIYTQELEPGEEGGEFTWDGTDIEGNPAPEGTYKIRVDALDGNDGAIRSTIAVSGIVRGVETQDGIIYLLVGDRAISLSSVINATLPPPQAAPVDETDTGDGTETASNDNSDNTEQDDTTQDTTGS